MHDQARDAANRLGVDELLSWLREYARTRINSLVIDERRCIPPYIALDFARVGLMGLQASGAYGGRDFSYRDSKRVSGQLAAIDLTLATFVGIHNLLGIRPLEAFGTEQAKADLLRPLAEGRMLGGLAITEPGAGSNPRALAASARRVASGWLLSGRKVWVGNGSWAGALNVFTRVTPCAEAPGGMLACAVSTTSAGLSHGLEAPTMGMRGVVQNEVVLEDVFVPDSHVLGRAGEGFLVAEDSFMRARLGIAFMSLGGMRRAIQLAWRYAGRRSIGTGPLADNGLSRRRVAHLVCATDALDALTETLAVELDAGGMPPAGAFLACKVLGPELLQESVDSAIQLLGGRGYIETNGLAQMFRDARLLRIFEGPTETMAAHLGFSVVHGAPRLQRYIAEQLGQPQIAQRLSDALQGLPEDGADEDELCFHVGLAAAHALLAACVAANGQARPQTLAWADAQLTRRLERIQAEPRPLEARAWLDERVADFTKDIGDALQSLPGMDGAADPLLGH